MVASLPEWGDWLPVWLWPRHLMSFGQYSSHWRVFFMDAQLSYVNNTEVNAVADNCDMAQEEIESSRNMQLLQQAAHRESLSQLGEMLPEDRECEDCGKSIPLARIKAVPHTTRCTQCQSFFERSHFSQ